MICRSPADSETNYIALLAPPALSDLKMEMRQYLWEMPRINAKCKREKSVFLKKTV